MLAEADRRRRGLAAGREARIWRRAASARADAEIAIGREIAERLGAARRRPAAAGPVELSRVGHHRQDAAAHRGFALAPPAMMDEAGLSHERADPAGQHQHDQLSRSPCRAAPIRKRSARPSSSDFPTAAGAPPSRNEAGSGTRRFIDRLGPDAAAGRPVGAGDRRARHVERRRRLCRLAPPDASPSSSWSARRARRSMRCLLIEIGLIAGARHPRRACGRARPLPRWSASSTGPLLPVTPDTSPQWVALGRSRRCSAC